MINQVVAKIKDINENISQLEKEKDTLNNELIELVLKNKKIINEDSWIISEGNLNTLKSYERCHTKLSELLCKQHHQSIEAPGCRIYFSDGEITLDFCSDEQFVKFVRNNNVIIDKSRIEKEIAGLSKTIKHYEQRRKEHQKLLQKARKLTHA